MDKKVSINIDHLVGSIHVSIHPSSGRNHQSQLPETEETSLGYKLSEMILQHLQNALSSPEMKDILEHYFQSALCEKPHQCTQDTGDSSSISQQQDV